MPTAGTHITILERLALQAEFSPLIGSPNAATGSAEETLHKFAKLGAIGPDIFYALMDYSDKLQDFTNFVAKTAGSFECISELTGFIDKNLKKVEDDATFGLSTIFDQAVAEFEGVFGHISALIHNGLMKAAIDLGFNAFPILRHDASKICRGKSGSGPTTCITFALGPSCSAYLMNPQEIRTTRPSPWAT
jgi:hypothetical protein